MTPGDAIDLPLPRALLANRARRSVGYRCADGGVQFRPHCGEGINQFAFLDAKFADAGFEGIAFGAQFSVVVGVVGAVQVGDGAPELHPVVVGGLPGDTGNGVNDVVNDNDEVIALRASACPTRKFCAGRWTPPKGCPSPAPTRWPKPPSR